MDAKLSFDELNIVFDRQREDVMAEFDFSTTLINALTTSTIRGIRLSPVVETDHAGYIAVLSTIGVVDIDTIRVISSS